MLVLACLLIMAILVSQWCRPADARGVGAQRAASDIMVAELETSGAVETSRVEVPVDVSRLHEACGTVEVRVVDEVSGLPCMGYAVSVVVGGGHSPLACTAVKSATIQGWNRLLVEEGGRLTGVPVPLNIERISDRVNGRDAFASGGLGDVTSTDQDGSASVPLPGAFDENMWVRVWNGPSVVMVPLPPALGEVTVRFPAAMTHSYRLWGGGVEQWENQRLFAVQRSSHAVCELTRDGGGGFLAPPPTRWVPFLLPDSGFALREAVALDSSAHVSALECIKVAPIDIVNASDGRPVTAAVLISLDAESMGVGGCRSMLSSRGRYYAPEVAGSVWLICAAGYVSQYCPLGTRLVKLDPGLDPQFDVHVECDNKPTDFDLILLPDSGASAQPWATPFMARQAHTGHVSRHTAPCGRYLIRPTDHDIACEIVDVRPGRVSDVVLPCPPPMVVRHHSGFVLRATDRMGRCAEGESGESKERESEFTGLVDGPIRVKAANGTERMFFLTKNNRLFSLDSDSDLPIASAQEVVLTPGWKATGSRKGETILVSRGDHVVLRHTNGTIGNCSWTSAECAIVLPRVFRTLRIANLRASDLEQIANVTLLSGQLALRLERKVEQGELVVCAPVVSVGLILVETGRNNYFVVRADCGDCVVASGEGPVSRRRTEPLMVAPATEGVHALVVDAVPSGWATDHFLGKGVCVWSASVPAGPAEGWQLITMNEHGMRTEPLMDALVRGAVLSP